MAWHILNRTFGGVHESGFSPNRLMDVETAIAFIEGHAGDGPVGAMGGAGMCDVGLFHAYKAETLGDRTPIAAYGMLPFVGLGSCDILNPDQMPAAAAVWVIQSDFPAQAYEEAARENWVFLKAWDGQIGWGRLNEDNYEDAAALKDALLAFYADVFSEWQG